MFRLRPPDWAIRRYLLGSDAPKALLTLFRNALSSVSVDVLQARLAALLTVDARPYLSQMKVPLLYLRGSRDRLVGEQSIRVIQRLFPAMRLESLDAPHLVLQRQPRLASEAIQKFFEECHP